MGTHPSFRRFGYPAILLLPVFFAILTGCTALTSRKPLEEASLPAKERDLKAYSRFLEQNMEMINEIYSTVYRPYPFVVDTAQGSVPIQSLVDPRAVTPAVAALKAGERPGGELIWSLYEYVIREYRFVVNARYWPTIDETLQRKEADCKGLSLLLLSLFLAAGYDSYAAISNGHMWVRGSDGLQWHTFELDKDPARKQVYGIKGFYDNPLFMVYPDQAFKRKRKE
jgi:transglutaminase-like putative cysteine protease